jgi:hypothetical protein
MEEFGFSVYMAEGMWNIIRPEDMPSVELRLKFWQEIQRRQWLMKVPDLGRDEIHIRGKTENGEVLFGKYVMWIQQ